MQDIHNRRTVVFSMWEVSVLASQFFYKSKCFYNKNVLKDKTLYRPPKFSNTASIQVESR